MRRALTIGLLYVALASLAALFAEVMPAWKLMIGFTLGYAAGVTQTYLAALSSPAPDKEKKS